MKVVLTDIVNKGLDRYLVYIDDIEIWINKDMLNIFKTRKLKNVVVI